MMDNFELNKAIAIALGKFTEPPKGLAQEVVGDTLHYYDERRTLRSCHDDYCDDWNALMPLVVEYNIVIEPRENLAYCFEGLIANSAISDSMQRAAAECLLKVLESLDSNQD